MSIGYEFQQELNCRSFSYGNIEEKIGFVSDNYYQAMDIYRTIVKAIEACNANQEEAHEILQKLRNDEEAWKQNGVKLTEAEKKEHAKRKAYYETIRDTEEIEVMYNGKVLKCTKLTYFITNHMRLFSILDKIDMKGRKKIGFVAFHLIRTLAWPTNKLINFTIKHTDDENTIINLVKWEERLDSISIGIRNKIVIP